VLERLEIAHKADEYSWNWSAGERQKFGLAMTFITRTPLVLLDEPTSHLDPRTARLIREFVKEDLNRRNGQTVLMSTHYLEEADQMCDRVAILRAGRLLACDNPAALKRAHVPDSILELRVAGYAPEVGQDLKARCGLAELLEHFEDVATGHAQLRPKWPDGAPPDPDALGRALEARGVAVLATERAAPTLDDVYFHLAREQVK
jgi:ABC-2 type transport system ATP-binding protein